MAQLLWLCTSFNLACAKSTMPHWANFSIHCHRAEVSSDDDVLLAAALVVIVGAVEQPKLPLGFGFTPV